MLKVLVWDSPPLDEALRAAQLRKRDVRLLVALSAAETLARARTDAPDVIILRATGDERTADLAHRLRALPSPPRPLLLLAVARSSATRSAAMAPFDGFLCVEDSEREPEQEGLPWASPGTRRGRRRGVRIPVRVCARENADPVDGVAVDIGDGGAGLLLPRILHARGSCTLTFQRVDGRRVSFLARAVWVRPSQFGPVQLGMRFLDATFDRRAALRDLALWERRDEAGGAVVRLFGELSEATPFGLLAARVGADDAFDLGEVERVNVVGLVRLAEFLSHVAASRRPRLRRVPDALLRQPWLAALMHDRCAIESYHLRYDCRQCKAEVPLLVAGGAPPPARRCPLCQGALAPDVTLPLDSSG